MKFTLLAVFSSAVAAVYAQTTAAGTTAPADAGVAINTPAFGQVITAGQPVTVTWTVTSASASTINNVDLRSGGSQNLQLILGNVAGAPLPVNPPTWVWNVPANIPTDTSYSLVFTGNNGAATYSPYFTIMGAPAGTNATISTSAASSAATPAAGAATSGSASAAASGSAAATASGAKNATTTASSAGNNLKAGLAGAAGVAGVVALLL